MSYNSAISSYSSTTTTRKLSLLEYFYVLVLIIYTAHANRYVVSFSIIENPIWFSVPIILSGILFLKWGAVFNKQFYLLILGFFLYFFAISIKYHEIRPTFFLNYIFSSSAIPACSYYMVLELFGYLLLGLTPWPSTIHEHSCL